MIRFERFLCTSMSMFVGRRVSQNMQARGSTFRSLDSVCSPVAQTSCPKLFRVPSSQNWCYSKLVKQTQLRGRVLLERPIQHRPMHQSRVLVRRGIVLRAIDRQTLSGLTSLASEPTCGAELSHLLWNINQTLPQVKQNGSNKLELQGIGPPTLHSK